MQAFAHEAYGEKLRRLRVRLEDKEAIAALHWRGTPDEDDALAAVEEVAEQAEEAGFVAHWGRKVLEIRPPVRIDKGAGIVGLLRETDLAAAVYVGDDITDLDAFRGPDASCRSWAGSATRCASACARTRARRRCRTRPTRWWTGPEGVRDLLRALLDLRFGDFLKATVLLSAASATLLAALTVIALSKQLDEQTAYLCVVWWLAVGADRHRASARATRTSPAIARLLATARSQTLLPELHPGRTLANRLWPLLLVTFGAGGAVVLLRRRSAGSPPASRSSGRSPGAARRPPWRRSRSATACASTSTGRRRWRRSGSSARPGFGGDFLRLAEPRPRPRRSSAGRAASGRRASSRPAGRP